MRFVAHLPSFSGQALRGRVRLGGEVCNMNRSRSLLLCVPLVLGLVFASASASGTATEPLARWLFETTKELPRSHAPGESRDDELVRLERLSRAYALAVVPYANGTGWTGSELAMALLILIYEETKLDERIHAGTGHPTWTEDRGLAKCLGQLHSSKLIPIELWMKLAGTDEESTLRCAEATAKVWVSVSKQCGAWIGQRASRERVAATFMAYGSGGSCTPDERAWARADKWLTRMQKRPDRSPVKGFRRAMPSEIPDKALDEAKTLLNSEDFKLGFLRTMQLGEPPKAWAFRVEQHADGKIGVSVLVAEK